MPHHHDSIRLRYRALLRADARFRFEEDVVPPPEPGGTGDGTGGGGDGGGGSDVPAAASATTVVPVPVRGGGSQHRISGSSSAGADDADALVLVPVPEPDPRADAERARRRTDAAKQAKKLRQREEAERKAALEKERLRLVKDEVMRSRRTEGTCEKDSQFTKGPQCTAQSHSRWCWGAEAKWERLLVPGGSSGGGSAGDWRSKKGMRKIRELAWGGVPPSVRGRAWAKFIGNHLNITRELFGPSCLLFAAPIPAPPSPLPSTDVVMSPTSQAVNNNACRRLSFYPCAQISARHEAPRRPQPRAIGRRCSGATPRRPPPSCLTPRLTRRRHS